MDYRTVLKGKGGGLKMELPGAFTYDTYIGCGYGRMFIMECKETGYENTQQIKRE